MDLPRPARRGEFTEIMRFLDEVFRPCQPGRFIMQRQYPHLFRNAPTYLRRILIVRDHGQLVGSLGIHPLEIKIEGALVSAGGVGQVATSAQRRGQGIMSALLTNAIGRMSKAGYPLSVLSGDRQRYGWFGWENGGTRNVFTVTERYIGKPNPSERRLRLRRLDSNKNLLKKLHHCSADRPYWAVRTQAQTYPLFKRNGREVFIAEAGHDFAYLVLGTRTGRRVDELGGNPELVLSMLRLLMARRGWSSIEVITGPNPCEVQLIQPFSGHWLRTNDCMLKILCIRRLVDQLRPVLQKRANLAGLRGTFRFEMGTDGRPGELDCGPGPVSVVQLSAVDMVKLFFGLVPVGEVFERDRLPSSLGRILPLPLYLSPLDHV